MTPKINAGKESFYSDSEMKHFILDLVQIIKEKYPLIYKGLKAELLKDYRDSLKALDTKMPVEKIKAALKSIGVTKMNKAGLPEADLSGVGVQNPKDQWRVVPVGAGSKKAKGKVDSDE